MVGKSIAALLLASLLSGCNTEKSKDDLCERMFEPYPDHITGRVVVTHQALLLSGMEHYTKGDFTNAVSDLEQYLQLPNRKKHAHLYLASAYLALGRPYDAELQLDHLENSTIRDAYRDQTEWYTVLCWLCSGQLDRALVGAQRIAEGRRHTYGREARVVMKELSRNDG